MVFQDVETDATVGVDVWVINFGYELALRRLEGVVGGEEDIQEENTACIWRIFWAHDSSIPMH